MCLSCHIPKCPLKIGGWKHSYCQLLNTGLAKMSLNSILCKNVYHIKMEPVPDQANKKANRKHSPELDKPGHHNTFHSLALILMRSRQTNID